VTGVLIDDSDQHFGVRRLREDRYCSRIHCERRKRVGGEDNDGNRGAIRIAVELREDLPAVEERHHQVQEHETWTHVAAANGAEGLATAGDVCHGKARAFEQRLEPDANLVVVVDDEHRATVVQRTHR